MKGKTPTHLVVVTNKDTKASAIVGAAWQNEWGLSVMLNPGTVLDWRMGGEYYISIKPKNERRSTNGVEEKPEWG